MYLIDETYFQRDLSIPNINETGTKVYKELEEFIDEKLRLLVRDFLSIDLVQDLENSLVNGLLPKNDPLIPIKWTNLVYGCEYQRDGKTLKWNGLCVELGTSKSSLLADYVYCAYLEYKNSILYGVGEIKGDAKVATSVNSTQRLVTIWNTFVEKYQSDGHGSLFYPYGRWENINYCYPVIIDYRHHNYSGVSLLQFLTDNPTDYPDVKPKFFNLKNSLGL